MSESSSDDEEICRLMEAVAPTFEMSSHNRYKSDKSNGKQGCARLVSKEPNSSAEVLKPKSKRTDIINTEEKWNSGHFESVDISSETQSFIAKKLSAALDRELEEQAQDFNDSLTIRDEDEETEANGILLFSNSTFKFTSSDIDRLVDRKDHTKRKPLNIDRIRNRKRKLVDDQDSDDEQTKLKSVAVSSDWVLGAK